MRRCHRRLPSPQAQVAFGASQRVCVLLAMFSCDFHKHSLLLCLVDLGNKLFRQRLTVNLHSIAVAATTDSNVG